MNQRLNRSGSKMTKLPTVPRNRSSDKLSKEHSQKIDTGRKMSRSQITSSLQVEEMSPNLPHRRCSSIRTRTSSRLNGSPSSNRSCSLRFPSQRRSEDLSNSPNGYRNNRDGSESRTSFSHSLSVPGDATEYHRLRNFSITSKGIINRGDSFRTRSTSTSRSSTPKTPTSNDVKDYFETATTSMISEIQNSPVGCSASNSVSQSFSSDENDAILPPPKYTVWLMGTQGVGKTSLKQQFMTSEYICQYDNWREENAEGSVFVVIDGEETELEIVECINSEEKLKAGFSPPDAYVIVYDVTNKRSFVQAKHLLSLVQASLGPKAIILAGNKTDLARLRTISTFEGRSLSKVRGCKFIETSVAINHQVDELLVGIVTQIRIKNKIAKKQKRNVAKSELSSVSLQPVCQKNKAARIIKRIWRRTCMNSKSCDNLHSV